MTEAVFSSRWAPLPGHAREVAPGTLPAGFRAAGVAAGIKPSGGSDVGLLVCDAPDATSAARFTRSGAQAAPVLLTRERCRLDALRAVVGQQRQRERGDRLGRLPGGGADAGRGGDRRGRPRGPGRRLLDRRDRRPARRRRRRQGPRAGGP